MRTAIVMHRCFYRLPAMNPDFHRVLSPLWALLVALGLFTGCQEAVPPTAFASIYPGLDYTNHRMSRIPWSVHIVRIDRSDSRYRVHSGHANGQALGLSPLTQILKQLPPELGEPVAAINGDFYQRDRAYAGDPRGLQILQGHLISAPVGGVAFWIDASGQPSAGPVSNRFEITWPNGSSTPFGLNQDRGSDRLILYTPLIGKSTKTSGGRELILEPKALASTSIRLEAGQEWVVRVREIREGGNSPVRPDTLVLSAGPALLRRLPTPTPDMELKLSTATVPDLRGATTAISGGPLLVHRGQRLKIEPPRSDSYEFSSMLERHPRSAVGWNKTHFFLVEVDGRQAGLSVGMTLEELSDYMANLGCDEAMNLDGGGSATFWCGGAIRNSPCDGHERAIANALVVLRQPKAPSAEPQP